MSSVCCGQSQAEGGWSGGVVRGRGAHSSQCPGEVKEMFRRHTKRKTNNINADLRQSAQNSFLGGGLRNHQWGQRRCPTARKVLYQERSKNGIRRESCTTGSFLHPTLACRESPSSGSPSSSRQGFFATHSPQVTEFPTWMISSFPPILVSLPSSSASLETDRRREVE